MGLSSQVGVPPVPIKSYARIGDCLHGSSAPTGCVALILLTVAMPRGFPYATARRISTQTLSNELRSRIDYPGFALLIAASAFLIVALEESGIQYAWSDPIPIAFLVLSGLLWIAFFAWENIASREGRAAEPVFTWRFVRNRVFLGVLLYVPLADGGFICKSCFRVLTFS